MVHEQSWSKTTWQNLLKQVLYHIWAFIHHFPTKYLSTNSVYGACSCLQTEVVSRLWKETNVSIKTSALRQCPSSPAWTESLSAKQFPQWLTGNTRKISETASLRFHDALQITCLKHWTVRKARCLNLSCNVYMWDSKSWSEHKYGDKLANFRTNLVTFRSMDEDTVSMLWL